MVSVTDTNFRGRGDLISVMYEKSGDENDAHGYSFTTWEEKKITKKQMEDFFNY